MKDKKVDVLSHVDKSGKAYMVNIGDKAVVRRKAIASGFIEMASNTLSLIRENEIAKGDVIATANIAGVMGGKECSSLIPLCHNIEIEQIEMKFDIQAKGIYIEACTLCTGKTGIEMEALSAVSIAALTLYDMCKAVDKGMIIRDIQLKEKTKSVVAGV